MAKENEIVTLYKNWQNYVRQKSVWISRHKVCFMLVFHPFAWSHVDGHVNVVEWCWERWGRSVFLLGFV